MEAAASGTPVIAFRRGALAEVVSDGVTGFLADSVDEAARVLPEASRISPAACVRHARENFRATKMAERYARLYERLVRTQSAVPVG
jgi:glycosyltransferase involved in cell wall biosynthesis